MKLTLKRKILLWFMVIILISFILYGFLIYFVYSFNLRGERYLTTLNEHLEGVDRIIVDRLKEEGRFGPFGTPLHLKILSPGLFIRIFYTITGGVLLIIIIAVSSGFLVLRRMLRQVNLITENVKEIDEKRLHLRLNIKGKDPISNMARVFDGMLDKIESSFKKQKQFIQNASHELNTPLTIMKIKIDILKQKKNIKKKEYRETIDLIDSEVMRLSKITEELLTLADIEENGYREKFIKINAKKTLEKIVRLFENQIISKVLKLKLKFTGEDSTIMGSEVQIEQLIFNLIDNAIKYSIPEKELKIEMDSNKDEKLLIINISNKSDIIKEKDIPYIFDRFYKTSASNDRKGFGLGLSISKKIVENHKGTIKVDYDKDKKEITFIISIPLFKNI
ncbi:MAG TPA: HAMP domain-containing sensor histidine kinase [Candidatus Hydromicrobium sp.]